MTSFAHTVTVKVKGGVVIDVETPDGVRVLVKDYDVLEPNEDHLRDDVGPFVQDEWTPLPPIKQANCKHQFEKEPRCAPAVLNHYHCDACDVSWTDEWSCGCDDECPECGTDTSPDNSEEIAPCSCEYL